MNNKRWYDLDPTVSLAVSLVRNASDNTQIKCAEYIINKAKDYGVEIETNLSDAFNYLLRRWYDQDKQLSESFEYLRKSPFEVQKEISLEIINFLQTSEMY